MNRKNKQKIQKVKIVIFDFDGVMTDNTVIVDQTGKESVVVSRADGMGIGILKKLGYTLLILSSEANPVVHTRADKLGIQCIQGADDKGKILKDYAKKINAQLDEIMYVGNDMNDIPAMEIVGCSVCPKDAHGCAKKKADLILKSNGGKGVVRELADILDKYTVK